MPSREYCTLPDPVHSTHTERMTTATTMPQAQIDEWVQAYLHAWTTNDPNDIAALFTETAEYHEKPYETAWIGRDAIVTGWRSRWQWQSGGWTFAWATSSIAGNCATITGVGHYAELGDFDNTWTVTFDGGLCSRFDMINTERVQ